jgi:hypothetical protein
MNVQINDYSCNGYVNRTERYEDGTVTYRGNEYDNGYFNIRVTTEVNNGYRLEEQVSGTVYNDGSYSNVQRQTISEQLPYAPTYRSLRAYEDDNRNHQYNNGSLRSFATIALR